MKNSIDKKAVRKMFRIVPLVVSVNVICDMSLAKNFGAQKKQLPGKFSFSYPPLNQLLFNSP